MALTGNECEDLLGKWRSDCAQYVTDEAACKSLFDYWVAEGCKFGGDDQYAIFHNRVCKECLRKTEEEDTPVSMLDDVKAAFDALVPLLNSWLTDIFDGLGDALEDMVDRIASWIGNLVKNIAGVFDAVGAVIQSIVDDIWKWFTGVLDEIKKIYHKVDVWISSVIASAKDWITQAYKDIAAWLGELATSIGDAIMVVYKKIGGWLDDALKWMGQAVKDIGKAIWDFLVWTGEQLQIAYDATLKPIGEWFVSLWKGFTDAIKKIGRWFADIDAMVKAFVNGLNESTWSGIEDLIGSLGDIFVGAFRQIGTDLMNLPDYIDEKLYDILSDIVANMLGISERLAKEVLKKGVTQPS